MRLLNQVSPRRAQVLLLIGALSIGVMSALFATALSDKASTSSVEANRVGIVVSCEALNGVIQQSRNIRSKPGEILFAIGMRLATPAERRRLEAAIADQVAHPERTGIRVVDCDRVVERAKAAARKRRPAG